MSLTAQFAETETAAFTAMRSALEAKLAERNARVADLRKRNGELTAELTTLKRDFTKFRNEVKRLLGHVPKSKHLIDEGQLPLFDGIGPTEPEPEPVPEHLGEAPDGETPSDSIRNRHKPKTRAKKTDTSTLPRTQAVHELPEDERICPETGVALVAVGETIVEELDYVAAELRIIEHHQIIYGPSPEVAEERTIKPIAAVLPPRPLEGCIAGAALIAQLLTFKYFFHLPLYRQEEAFRHAGLSLPRSTLCDWVLKAAFELNPIARFIETAIRAGPVLQLDDTPIKCQAGKGHGNFQAYLWSFISPTSDGVAFRFTKGRSTADLAPLLEGASAQVLLGDGYAGNKSAAREAGLEVEFAGCRVGEDVAALAPHRSGRAEFPHPVPRVTGSLAAWA